MSKKSKERNYVSNCIVLHCILWVVVRSIDSALCDVRFSELDLSQFERRKNYLTRRCGFTGERFQDLQTNIIFSCRFLKALLESRIANDITFRRKVNVMNYWFIFRHCISHISITDNRFILSRISVIWANEGDNVLA